MQVRNRNHFGSHRVRKIGRVRGGVRQTQCHLLVLFHVFSSQVASDSARIKPVPDLVRRNPCRIASQDFKVSEVRLCLLSQEMLGRQANLATARLGCGCVVRGDEETLFCSDLLHHFGNAQRGRRNTRTQAARAHGMMMPAPVILRLSRAW
jgi:hypothetical protein